MMTQVFVVQHVAREGQQDEDVKFIGVYSTRSHAEQAVVRLAKQPGFCDFVEGFHIDNYALDEDHWVEGFLSDA